MCNLSETKDEGKSCSETVIVGAPALVALERYLELLDVRDGFDGDAGEIAAAFDAVEWQTPLFETGDAIWRFIIAVLLWTAPLVRERKISLSRAMNRLAMIAESRSNFRILRRRDLDRLLFQLVTGEIPAVLPQQFSPDEVRTKQGSEDGYDF